MKRILVFTLVFVALFVGTEMSSARGEIMVVEPADQFAYANSLYDSKDYISAVVEFKRFLHFFPLDLKAPEARFLLGMAWFDGGKTGEALKVFSDIAAKTPGDPYAMEAAFMIVTCHERSGNPVLGEVELGNLIRGTSDIRVKDRAYHTLGFLHLDNGAWDKAKNAFSNISPSNRPRYSTDFLLHGLEKTGEIPSKNPVAAGIFSIVPGAGFLYCERPKDALVSFLVNGGLIYSAVRSFKRDDYALGAVVTFVGFGFYAGNIHGSITSAHKYNKAQNRRFVRELKQKVPMSSGLFSGEPMVIGLSLSICF